MDRSFFDANRDITIYMPNQIFHYKIFAAYLYDDRHLMMHYNFWNPEDYQQYLDSIFSIRDMNAFIDTSVKVDHEDKNNYFIHLLCRKLSTEISGTSCTGIYRKIRKER